MIYFDTFDTFGLLLLIINFYYMMSFGLVGLFAYLKLILGVFFKKIDKIKQIKYINILSYIGVFPSITLFLFLLLEFFDDKKSFFFVYALKFKNTQDALFGLSFVLLWFMPALFLLFKKCIIHRNFYIKFSLIWYGIIIICLALQLSEVVVMYVFKRLTF